MKREPGREQGAPRTRRRRAVCPRAGPPRVGDVGPAPQPASRGPPTAALTSVPAAPTETARLPLGLHATRSPTSSGRRSRGPHPRQAGPTPTHGDVSAPGGVASPPRRAPGSLRSEGGSRRAFLCGQWVSRRHAVWAACPAAGVAISTSRFERFGPFLLALSLTSSRGDVTHREPERLNPGNPAGTPRRWRPCVRRVTAQLCDRLPARCLWGDACAREGLPLRIVSRGHFCSDEVNRCHRFLQLEPCLAVEMEAGRSVGT